MSVRNFIFIPGSGLANHLDFGDNEVKNTWLGLG